MQFDPENHIVKLCTQGMEFEGRGEKEKASLIFQQAWNESSDATEKFIAAHYLARHQETIAAKLHWDQTALKLALQVADESVQSNYPSLYLNIAKCFEDMAEFDMAKDHYLQAHVFASFLPEDGYGKMIKSGIDKGLERVSKR